MNNMFGMKEESKRLIIENNLSWDSGKYIVCNEAVKFPEYFKPENKTPAIDMILIDPEQKILYLTAYKCGLKDTFEDENNIRTVCEDYIDFRMHIQRNEFAGEMIKQYNKIRKKSGKPEITEDNASEYRVRILFLFTKTAIDNDDPADDLEQSDIDRALDEVRNVIKEKHFNKLSAFYYYADKPEDVKFTDENMEVL